MLLYNQIGDGMIDAVVVVVAIAQSQAIVASYNSQDVNVVVLHTFYIGYGDGILKSIVIFLLE